MYIIYVYVYIYHVILYKSAAYINIRSAFEERARIHVNRQTN